MIRPFDGKMPKIADTAFVSEWAYVIGDVEVGEYSGIWPGAVVRADFALIKIGKNCQIEDNSVLHSGATMEIGDDVMIGHGVVVHGLKIGNDVLVGNNATILDFSEIGDHCIVAANSVVSSGQKIPDYSFVVGTPAKIKKQLSSEEIEAMHLRRREKYSTLRGEQIQGYTQLVTRYKEQGL